MAALREQYEALSVQELERVLSEVVLDRRAQNTLKSVINEKAGSLNIQWRQMKNWPRLGIMR